MAASKSTKNPEVLAETANSVFSGISSFFIVVVLLIFPLFVTKDHYYSILRAKYSFYYITILIMLGIVLFVSLIFCFVDQMEYGGYNRKRLFKSLSPRVLWKRLTIMDKTLLVFWFAAALATVQSDYVYESFWGNEGRYSGLFLLSLYILTVFVIGKLGKFKRWHLGLFLFAGALVCLFGITDYFRMDILSWKAGIKTGQQDSFVSTIGNVNTYTAFVALVMGTAAGLFITEHKNVLRACGYYVVLIISYFAIIMGESDNAYLAVGAMFALLPLVLFATRRGIRQYLILAASLATVLKCVAFINVKYAGTVITLTGLFKALTGHRMLTYIVIALWAAVIVLYIGDRSLFKDKEDRIGKWLRILWAALLAAAFVTVVWILYDANFGGHAEKYQEFSQYLIFNDAWGTHRGYCWRIGWESYVKQPIHHKLFGFGPDTYGILVKPFREESISTYGVYFENAHNEYFQYLTTVGVFGVLAYIAFLIASCALMVKNLKKKPWVMASLLAVICYAAQAVVNINLPIATPIMWMLLAGAAALCRADGEKTADDGASV